MIEDRRFPTHRRAQRNDQGARAIASAIRVLFALDATGSQESFDGPLNRRRLDL